MQSLHLSSIYEFLKTSIEASQENDDISRSDNSLTNAQITLKFRLLAVPVACLTMSSVMMCLWMFLPSDRLFFGALRLKNLQKSATPFFLNSDDSMYYKIGQSN